MAPVVSATTDKLQIDYKKLFPPDDRLHINYKITSLLRQLAVFLRTAYSCVCYLFATFLLPFCYLFATLSREKSKAR